MRYVGWTALVTAATALCAVGAFPSGAPKSVCLSMAPSHQGAAPRPPASFDGSVSPGRTTFLAGRPLRVTMYGAYKGLMVQARLEGRRDRRLGSWVDLPAGFQEIECLGGGRAVTHSDNSFKSNSVLTWLPPPTAEGRVQFVATVVADLQTFWVGLNSSFVTPEGFNNSNTPLQTSPAGAVTTPATTPRPQTRPPSTGSTPQRPATSTDVHPLTTLAPTAPRPTDNDLAVDRSTCGVTKHCFYAGPPGCDRFTCPYLVTVQPKAPTGSELTVELHGPNHGWMAVGFSRDALMGEDDVYACQFPFSYSGTGSSTIPGFRPALVNYWTPGGHSPPVALATNAARLLSARTVNYLGPTITCTFTRPTSPDPGRYPRAVSLAQPTHLVLVYGPVDSTAGLEQHAESRPALTRSRVLLDNTLTMLDMRLSGQQRQGAPSTNTSNASTAPPGLAANLTGVLGQEFVPRDALAILGVALGALAVLISIGAAAFLLL